MIGATENPGDGGEPRRHRKPTVAPLPLDTANHFFALLKDGLIYEMEPPRGPQTPEQTLSRAAWLVSMAVAAGEPLDKFARLLQAIKNS